jgi:hypothetical protein
MSIAGDRGANQRAYRGKVERGFTQRETAAPCSGTVPNSVRSEAIARQFDGDHARGAAEISLHDPT